MKKILSSITLSVATIIITLIFIEIILHIIDIPKYSTPSENYRRTDEIYHHGLIPNTQGRIRSPEYDFYFSVNSYGLRDYEVNLETERYKILMLGDSFTEGAVDINNTISKQLEKNLLGKGYDAIVMTAGIASFSPILEYLYLKKEGINFNPKTVILNLDLSDVQDDYNYEKIAIKDERGNIISVPGSKTAPSWKDIGYFCGKFNLNLCVLSYRFIWNILWAKRLSDPNFIVEGDINTDRWFPSRYNLTKDQYEIHYNRTFEYVKKISDFLKERNVTFILVTYPYGHQVNAKEWSEGRTRYKFSSYDRYSLDFFKNVSAFAEANRIFYINTYYKFDGNDQFPHFYSSDIHLNADGNKLVAEAIAEQMFLNDEIKNSIPRIAE